MIQEITSASSPGSCPCHTRAQHGGLAGSSALATLPHLGKQARLRMPLGNILHAACSASAATFCPRARVLQPLQIAGPTSMMLALSKTLWSLLEWSTMAGMRPAQQPFLSKL